jgi:ParB family chromosome partitioning protein
MSRKATIDAIFTTRPAAAPPPRDAAEPPPELEIKADVLGAPNRSAPAEGAARIRSGAIGAMGASLKQMQ